MLERVVNAKLAERNLQTLREAPDYEVADITCVGEGTMTEKEVSQLKRSVPVRPLDDNEVRSIADSLLLRGCNPTFGLIVGVGKEDEHRGQVRNPSLS